MSENDKIWNRGYRAGRAAKIKKLQAENKRLRSLKCPPISDGDTCICPIEELEAELAAKDEKIEEIGRLNKIIDNLTTGIEIHAGTKKAERIVRGTTE